MRNHNDAGADAEAESNEDQRAYLVKRAADHRRLADRTTESTSRTIHLRLAQLYEDQADLIEIVPRD